jgi:uroporphyrinogen-III synthase/uroporphyrinogen III methyltransferase/synthase
MTAQPLSGGRVLAGKRILVTRAAHQAGKLSEGLRALGAKPVEVPVLEIRPPEDYAQLDEALRRLDQYDWFILTSANAIPIIHVRMMDLDIPLSKFKPRVAAIGEATAQAVELLLHIKVSLTPKEYVAESLVAELAPQIAGKRVLLARAAVARDLIPDALRVAGASVDVVDAYRNVMPDTAPDLLRAALEQGIDAAAFTSSSSVTHLAEAARLAGIDFPFTGVAAVSIGPITSQTLRDLGWEPAAEASPSHIPGLIAAVTQVLEQFPK